MSALAHRVLSYPCGFSLLLPMLFFIKAFLATVYSTLALLSSQDLNAAAMDEASA